MSFGAARNGVAPLTEKAIHHRPAEFLFVVHGGDMVTTYSEKLKDPRWQRKRLEVMERDEFCCQICMDSGSTLHVHHKRYVKGRNPWEYEIHDLATVCENCHESAHEKMFDATEVLASFEVSDAPWGVDRAATLMAGFFDGYMASRDRPVLHLKYLKKDPELYVFGEICAALTDFHSGSRLEEVFIFHNAVVEKGHKWIWEALMKAVKEDVGFCNGQS